jgi:hypothetical protein
MTKYLKREFNVHGSVHHNNILIYIQQDGTLHSLFYLETALHVSGGTTTHHQECKQLYLQHLVFVTPLPLPAAIAAGSSMAVFDSLPAASTSFRVSSSVFVPTCVLRAKQIYKLRC